jgi:hypothetical protein
MTDIINVRITHRDVVRVMDNSTTTKIVRVGIPGPHGASGPPGFPSTDHGNAIIIGSDGGLYCQAVTTATTDW